MCRCPRCSHSQSTPFTQTLRQNRLMLRYQSPPVSPCWQQGSSNFFRPLRYFLQSPSGTSLQMVLLWMVFFWVHKRL